MTKSGREAHLYVSMGVGVKIVRGATGKSGRKKIFFATRNICMAHSGCHKLLKIRNLQFILYISDDGDSILKRNTEPKFKMRTKSETEWFEKLINK